MPASVPSLSVTRERLFLPPLAPLSTLTSMTSSTIRSLLPVFVFEKMPRARLASSGVGALTGHAGPVRMVTKFGGSSCGSAAAYNHLADYFAGELAKGNQVVGVFSAMFAVTDRLLNAIGAAKRGDADLVAQSRAEVWDLHESTLRELVNDAGRVDERLDWMHERMHTYFDATVERVTATGSCSAYDRDMISHMGERLSIGMIHSLCEDRGIPSALVESDTLLVTR